MCLINGTDGIGTGWSTNIPCYNPKDVVKNILRKLEGESLFEMTPFYKGFKGEIIINGVDSQERSKRYECKGVYNLSNEHEDVIEVTELPIGRWTKDMKESYEKMSIGDNALIEDIR